MTSHPLLRLSLLPSRPLKSPFPPPSPASHNRVGPVSSEAGPTRLRAQRRSIVLPAPPHNLAHAASTTRPRPPRRTLLTTCMSSSSSKRDYNHNTPAVDRLVSAVAYVLPLLKGLSYGRYLFVKYPSLAEALEPVLPLLNLYHSIPYASLVSFFALYLGVARNPRFSRYVRFNAMQAIVLQVFLAFPLLLQQILSPRTGLGYKLMVMVYNTLFAFVVCCFVYSVVCCILGRTPYLPFVAEAADRQV